MAIKTMNIKYKSWNKELEKVKNIEGLLVPGQERVFMLLSSCLKKGSHIVEIGSFKGKSTSCLALGAKTGVTVHAIDTFSGNNEDFSEGVQFVGGGYINEFKHNLKKAGVLSKVKIHQGLSSEIGKGWKQKIDFLFIDGSHIYKDVKKDFELFYPWVKPGGIVAFHDVHPNFDGVYKVWNKIAKKKLKEISNFQTLYYGLKSGINKNLELVKYKRAVFNIKHNKVYVIIAVHNRLKFTIKCLASLANQKYKNFETIVIDDGSTDGTSAFIKKHYPKVKLINGNGKWWWSKSMNKGIDKALETAEEFDYVLTMNNDCYFQPDYLGNIVNASKDHDNAIVGSIIVDAKDPTKVIDAGVVVDWKNSSIYGVADHISNDFNFYKDKSAIRMLDTLPGKGTLVPIEVFRNVGKFKSTLLPHYIADYEFFWRARKWGSILIVDNKSIIYNFSKETGIDHLSNTGVWPFSILRILFSRKSKLNILDQLIFTLLCCPKEYILSNLWQIFLKFLNHVFPFYYKLKLFAHNIPIYITQNTIYIKVKRYFTFEKS